MSKTMEQADNTLLLLLDVSSGVSLYLLTTIIDVPIRMASSSFSLVFLISNGILKTFLKTFGRKKISIERLLY